jgi:hypothetical protein
MMSPLICCWPQTPSQGKTRLIWAHTGIEGAPIERVEQLLQQYLA